MINPQYRVEILDKNLAPLATIKNLAELNKEGMILDYQTKLSDYGHARFRVATKDPAFDPTTGLGDIFQPYKNHVRIIRNGTVVWQGVIVNNPQRTKNFIEVEAFEYEFLLKKYVIPNNSADGNYYQLNSGTLAAAVTDVINKVKAGVGAGNVLSNLTVGTIENPNFPAYFTNSSGTNIGGTAWNFNADLLLQFDFRDAYYIIQQLGIYGVCDWQIIPQVNQSTNTTTLVFNFKVFIGNKQPQLGLSYGPTGMIEDYNVPLSGENQVNNILGVGADYNLNILKEWRQDSDSVNTYGNLQGVGAYADAKSVNYLRSRMAEELLFTATPDSEIALTLNDKAYPLGQYGVGDTITVNIKDHVIKENRVRRIVGIDCLVHSSGAEKIDLATNVPRSTQ